MAEPAAVRAVAVTQSDVPDDISAVGNVESMATVDVKSRVAGQVLRVAFQEGQNVTKDQLLFEIDPEPIRRQNRRTPTLPKTKRKSSKRA